ncbi:MAG: hypothetical protein ACRDYA_04405 [Egibacteraceae bacterium]
MSGRVEGVPRLIRVEWHDQHGIAVSCAKWGDAAQIWAYDPVQLLPWKLIEHLLAEHWDGAHDPTLIDGQAGP